MLRIDDSIDLLVVSDSDFQLLNRDFEDKTFSRLEFAPSKRESLLIQDVKFRNCKTSPGTSWVSSRTRLERVLFENFDCGDEFRISASTDLEEVVILGSKPERFSIQPEEDEEPRNQCEDSMNARFMVDISKYSGEATVLGIPARLVVRNPLRHVVVRQLHGPIIRSSDAALSPLSFWKIYVKKLLAFGCEEGVFSLPEESHKKFPLVMKEKARLEGLGLTFS